MGKYCTDCAGEIETDKSDMMAFSETVRCKKCLGAKDDDGGFGDGNIGTKSKSS